MNQSLDEPQSIEKPFKKCARLLTGLVLEHSEIKRQESNDLSSPLLKATVLRLGALFSLAEHNLIPPLSAPFVRLIERLCKDSESEPKAKNQKPMSDDCNYSLRATGWIEDSFLAELLCEEAFLAELTSLKRTSLFQGVSTRNPLFTGWLHQFLQEGDQYSRIRESRSLDSLAPITQWYTPDWIAQYLCQELNLAEISDNSQNAFKVIDPACGTGHLLVPIYKKLSQRFSLEEIHLRHLYGLDIDKEVVNLSAFAIYLVNRDIVRKRDQIITGFPDFPLPRLYYFADVENREPGSQSQIGSFLLGAEGDYPDVVLIDLEGNSHALHSMPEKFDRLVANPPYLSNRLMPSSLQEFLKTHYPVSRYDLYTGFLDLATRVLEDGGIASFICQQSFLSISRYEALRKKLMRACDFRTIALLGTGTFASRGGEKVNSTILSFSKKRPAGSSESDAFSSPSLKIARKPSHPSGLYPEDFEELSQKQLFYLAESISGYPIAPGCPPEIAALFLKLDRMESATSGIKLTNGLFTCNNKKFVLNFRDVNPDELENYVPYDKGGGRKWYATTPYLLHWIENGDRIREYRKKRGQSGKLPGEKFYFQPGITYSYIGTSGFNARLLSPGAVFDIASSSLFSEKTSIYYLLGFLNSSLVRYLLGTLNPTINFQIGDLRKIPYIEPSEEIESSVELLTKRAVEIAKFLERFDPRSPAYCGEQEDENKIESLIQEEKEIQKTIDRIIFNLYELSDKTINLIGDNPWVKEKKMRSVSRNGKKQGAGIDVPQAVRNRLINPDPSRCPQQK